MEPVNTNKPLVGTLTVPVYDGKPHQDPFTRPYMAPPKPDKTVRISFPLIDFRDGVLTSGGDYVKEAAFMSRHGFTAVKHKSRLENRSEFDNSTILSKVYYPEIEDLVKQVTGCKTVVVTNSTCRGGKPPSAPDQSDVGAFKGAIVAEGAKVEMSKVWHRPVLGQPVRLPHNDSTALGGRQSVRDWMTSLTKCATSAGIIDYEDSLRGAAETNPREQRNRDIIEQHYNDHKSGKLGPRYAVFSIWRPTAPVTRDPLALVPWNEVAKRSDFVIEPYLNRADGANGDWLKELAMMKIRPEALELNADSDLKWFYVSNMQPDEVLFVKMFDTAGLGDSSGVELGCLHGSPDLGAAGHGQLRESVEVRCMAFW